MKPKLISHAAEAKLFHSGNTVIKYRIKKSYRLPILDSRLRKQRTRREARLLQKVSSLIPVPLVLHIDEARSTLNLEYIKGKKLSDCLDSLPDSLTICKTIGAHLAKLHDANIVHGDLTTSNMILSPNNKLYFIDFGLSFESNRIEDKAVDLHLIKEAFEAKHFKQAEKLFNAVIKGYKSSKNSFLVLQRLAVVEKRGRYKQQD